MAGLSWWFTAILHSHSLTWWILVGSVGAPQIGGEELRIWMFMGYVAWKLVWHWCWGAWNKFSTNYQCSGRNVTPLRPRHVFVVGGVLFRFRDCIIIIFPGRKSSLALLNRRRQRQEEGRKEGREAASGTVSKSRLLSSVPFENPRPEMLENRTVKKELL